jgi:magnesium transporter
MMSRVTIIDGFPGATECRDSEFDPHRTRNASVLTVYFADGSHARDPGAGKPGVPAIWFDLLDPDADEVALARRASGMQVPSREEMSGLKLSGRFRVDDHALHLNIPIYVHAEAPEHKPGPLGFVLGVECLVSVRYGKSSAFERAASQLDGADRSATGVDAFVAIVEAIADVTTEVMENVGEQLAELSRKLFREGRHSTRRLREGLHEVGRLESHQAHTRNSSLGMVRMLNFICENEPDWIDAEARSHFASLRRDLRALDEFDEQLTEKLQFLLDAILGFINTDQNEIMQVLTVASVATIPPIILVGIWGMNFARMPELGWSFGYPLALATIGLSLALPLVWFKLRGWL